LGTIQVWCCAAFIGCARLRPAALDPDALAAVGLAGGFAGGPTVTVDCPSAPNCRASPPTAAHRKTADAARRVPPAFERQASWLP
jgi:hypothetical protein